MSEKPDKDSRTEQATEKHLNDAKSEGNVPVSREASNFAFLLAAIVAISTLSSGGAPWFVQGLSVLLSHACDIRLERSGDVVRLMGGLGSVCAIVVVPLILIYAVAGVAASVIQNKPVILGKRVMPDFSRISPMQGLKRLLSASGLLEFGKTTVRAFSFVGAISYAIFSNWDRILTASLAGPGGVLRLTQSATVDILLILTGISLAMLALDLPLGTLLWRRSLKMSHREIKDERRQIEGDAHVKARRRSIAKARMRRRLKSDVSRATVVIANPTHFAVALRYVRLEGGAPRLVAKGQDIVALTIRRIAEENRIPIVEDKALARSLYKKVAVDQAIPVEFYRVIAEILIKLQAHRRSTGLSQVH